ncbi:hypothetical protein J6590_034111 [Homalodisca vitripennis]|nr:hypothetical protein J6590_034111 [Homalodisca vitripennis]
MQNRVYKSPIVHENLPLCDNPPSGGHPTSTHVLSHRIQLNSHLIGPHFPETELCGHNGYLNMYRRRRVVWVLCGDPLTPIVPQIYVICPDNLCTFEWLLNSSLYRPEALCSRSSGGDGPVRPGMIERFRPIRPR